MESSLNGAKIAVVVDISHLSHFDPLFMSWSMTVCDQFVLCDQIGATVTAYPSQQSQMYWDAKEKPET